MLPDHLCRRDIPGLGEAILASEYAELEGLTEEKVAASIANRSTSGVKHEGIWYVEAPSLCEDRLSKMRARQQRPRELDPFETVAAELHSGNLVQGLWTRAYAEVDGDEARTKAAYIRYRVAQLTGTNYTISQPPTPVQIVSEVRPWVRYWARLIDVFLFSIFLGFVLGYVAPNMLAGNRQLLGMLFAFLWCFVEPIFLSEWGATPGKALLRVSVSKQDGSSFEYFEALARSFDVWFRGFGVGFPLVSFFTVLVGYNTLTKHGITTWDLQAKTRVTHQVIGPIRIIIAILLFVVFAYFVSLGSNRA